MESSRLVILEENISRYPIQIREEERGLQRGGSKECRSLQGDRQNQSAEASPYEILLGPRFIFRDFSDIEQWDGDFFLGPISVAEKSKAAPIIGSAMQTGGRWAPVTLSPRHYNRKLIFTMTSKKRRDFFF
ncbi:hypothetical protein HNY73_017734 [Argiope bruennichi]|uniref:Uncharacterized protein n=1 Tax=Argiope bruennichi TaxID=94029 RepID=A0A8T0EBZ9_ARGBR|nr:hypothetical protein HNY73_017734 [Argiope bruennichi]